MARRVAARLPGPAARLARACWPGGLTLVLPARPGLPGPLTAGTGTIGVRAPDHPVALGLLRVLGRPITGTSANRTGGRALRTARAVGRILGRRVALVLDGPPRPRGTPSTVVRVRGRDIERLRPGAVSPARLRRALRGETKTLRRRGVSGMG
jgi:L-threonylcarbamoyladenylate synthase